MHALLWRGMGSRSRTYLIDLRFSYRLPAAMTQLIAVCGALDEGDVSGGPPLP
jgi:hypothetical protein